MARLCHKLLKLNMIIFHTQNTICNIVTHKQDMSKSTFCPNLKWGVVEKCFYKNRFFYKKNHFPLEISNLVVL